MSNKFFAVTLLALLSATRTFAAASNAVTADAFTVERPTLLSLGFEWRIDGDDKLRGWRNVASASYVTDGADNGLDIVDLLLNLLIEQCVDSLWPVSDD